MACKGQTARKGGTQSHWPKSSEINGYGRRVAGYSYQAEPFHSSPQLFLGDALSRIQPLFTGCRKYPIETFKRGRKVVSAEGEEVDGTELV